MREHPIRTSGAAWMIRLGALFVLCVTPLEIVYFRLWGKQRWQIPSGKGYSTVLTNYWIDGSWKSVLTSTALSLLYVLPSLAASVLRPGLRLDRATLLAAFLLLANLSYEAYTRIRPADAFIPSISLVDMAPWVAAVPTLAGIVAIVGAYVLGVPSSTLAPLARRMLAAGILWPILLEWNNLRMSPRYFPGWIGATGALMILLGEILRRDDRMDSPAGMVNIRKG